MVFPNYPFIYFPDSLEKQFAATAPSDRQQIELPSIEFQPIEPPEPPINFNPIVKLVRVAGWIFSGLVGANLLNGLLSGASLTDSLPAILVLLVKTLLVTGSIYYVQKFDEQQQQDYKKQQQLYWQKNQRRNQSIAERLSQQTSQKLRSLNPQLRIKRKGYLEQYSLTRGENRADAQKGVSESYFHKYLQKYFYDCEIANDYFALNAEIGYTTDFSLVFDKKYGIDIEIDEPYAGKSKQPHHCQDDERDRNRNDYFLKRGWIVVRFSEYQVVSDPESCCLEIAKIIERLGEPKYLSALSTVVDLPADRSWTRSSAKAMAARKYRELYLDRAGLFIYNPERERRNAKQTRRVKTKSSNPKYKLKLRKRTE